MAHYLAELYTSKPAWLVLSQDERHQFFNAVGYVMPALFELEVKAIALGKVDHTKLHSASQTFYAIWCSPADAAMTALVNGTAQSKWHDYFETINAGGKGIDLVGHLAQLGEAIC